MNKIVGHLIGEHSSLSDVGRAYNYRMAGNGLFIMSIGKHISAQIPIADVPVRGLPPTETFVRLEHGRIPSRFFDLALSVMLARPETEVYIGIAWTGDAYQLVIPEQNADTSSVQYNVPSGIVCELHSHSRMKAFFSATDDQDEQGLKIYGVVGDLCSAAPGLKLRVGVYGYFTPVKWMDVFDGPLGDVKEEDYGKTLDY